MVKDYDVYVFKWIDYVTVIVSGAAICFTIGYLFYKIWWAGFLLTPYFIFFFKKQREKKVRNRKLQLNMQFKDAILNIASSLEAGYSIENAFKATAHDLAMIYEEDAFMICELKRIVAQVSNNIPIEEALNEFADRAKLEDIDCFVEVFASAKRSGGDLIQIIRSTSKTMSDKVETLREIETMITAKKLEVTIMKLVPYGIIAYLSICNPGILAPLYHNFFGVCFMTVMLLLCWAISSIADRIMNIEF